MTDRADERVVPVEHDCPDWDFMRIRPGDPEMEGCACFPRRITMIPTSEMMHAGWARLQEKDLAGNQIYCYECGEIFKAMVAAAPANGALLLGVRHYSHDMDIQMGQRVDGHNCRNAADALAALTRERDELLADCTDGRVRIAGAKTWRAACNAALDRAEAAERNHVDWMKAHAKEVEDAHRARIEAERQLAAAQNHWLEEAAKVCMGTGEEGESPDCWGWHAKDYARAIRALMKRGAA